MSSFPAADLAVGNDNMWDIFPFCDFPGAA
jgi:hypothetical protein